MNNEKIAKAVVQACGFKLLNAEGEWVMFKVGDFTFNAKVTDSDTIMVHLPDAERKEFNTTSDAMRWLAQVC
jgi:hypothetical protein